MYLTSFVTMTLILSMLEMSLDNNQSTILKRSLCKWLFIANREDYYLFEITNLIRCTHDNNPYITF